MTRILVVGGGSIGQRHRRVLGDLARGPVALVEPSEERRAGQAFATLDEGLAWGPDAVVVASPTDLHLAQARAVVGAGLHVFVEKPLSHRRDGVEELRAAAEAAELVTMVACNMRFHPVNRELHRQLEARRVGRPLSARLWTGSYLPRWRPGSDYKASYSASPVAGGAILDCIHELDLARWFFGPARVLAAAHRPAAHLGLEVDGLAEVLLRHESGVLASVHLDYVQRNTSRGATIIGEEGTLEARITTGEVKVYGPDGERAEVFAVPQDWELDDMYRDQMRHFLDAVEAGTPTTNPIAGGAEVLALALAARDENAWGSS